MIVSMYTSKTVTHEVCGLNKDNSFLVNVKSPNTLKPVCDINRPCSPNQVRQVKLWTIII